MRPHWAMHELGLDYRTRMVAPRSGELQTPEFRTLNPREKVPLLQDGDLVLCESAAIVNYLADRYGPDSGLIPTVGSSERALYDQWCFLIMMELDAHTLYVIRKHGDLAAVYGEAPAAIAAAKEGFSKQVLGVESEIEARGPWLLGSTFTGADILLETCLAWAGRVGIKIGPTLDDYLARAQRRPAYQAASSLNYSINPDGSPRA
jgi:glutathione S-transferase